MNASPPFHTRYGFSRPAGGRPITPVALEIRPYKEICHRGALRPTVLASAVDLVASLFVREIAGTDATLTSDLSLRVPARAISEDDPLGAVPERIDARGEVLREGKRLITTAVHLEVAGALFAYGESTFARIARAADKAPSLESLQVPKIIDAHPLTQPLVDEVGIEVIDAATGGIRLPLRNALRNPEGILQGALVALMVEASAEALADSARRQPQIVCELDLRYLAAARVGPVLGQATWIGEPETGVIRVELRDHGQQDRLTTSALVRVADAPRL